MSSRSERSSASSSIRSPQNLPCVAEKCPFVPLARQLGAASVERELYKLSTANIPSFATDDNKLDEWLQDEQIAELQIGSRLARHRQRWEAHCAAVGEEAGRGLCAAE